MTFDKKTLLPFIDRYNADNDTCLGLDEVCGEITDFTVEKKEEWSDEFNTKVRYRTYWFTAQTLFDTQTFHLTKRILPYKSEWIGERDNLLEVVSLGDFKNGNMFMIPCFNVPVHIFQHIIYSTNGLYRDNLPKHWTL
jgi:hypothetical protein